MKNVKQILIVEDEPTCQIMLMQTLVPKYQVELSTTIARAEEFLKHHKPDLILLDFYLPDGNAFQLIESLKTSTDNQGVPIVLLTQESDIQVKVRSFAEGVYDFITKPFNSTELLARIDAHMARSGEINAAIHRPKKVGQLELDTDAQKVCLKKCDGHTDTLRLSPAEFKILQYLMNHCGKVRTREQLAENVWKRKYFQSRTIDRHISSIRKKLGDCAYYLQTVSQGGYRLAYENAENL